MEDECPEKLWRIRHKYEYTVQVHEKLIKLLRRRARLRRRNKTNFIFAYCQFYEEKSRASRKESTLNFWLWRGHGFEKYNVKRFSFHRFFSPLADLCMSCCYVLYLFFYTLHVNVDIVSILTSSFGADDNVYL